MKKMIGVIKPTILANNFVQPVFIGVNGIFVIQKYKNWIVTEFIETTIVSEKIHFFENEKNIQSEVGSGAIFAFFTEKEVVYVGKRKEIFSSVIGFIYDDNFEPFNKVVITSFFCMHSKTSFFIDKTNEIFKEEKFNCFIDEKDYIKCDLPSIKVKENQIMVEEFIRKVIDYICLDKTRKTSFLDFLYIKNGFFIFDDFKIDENEFNFNLKYLMKIYPRLRNIFFYQPNKKPNQRILKDIERVRKELGNIRKLSFDNNHSHNSRYRIPAHLTHLRSIHNYLSENMIMNEAEGFSHYPNKKRLFKNSDRSIQKLQEIASKICPEYK